MTHPESWYPLDKDEIIYSPEVYIVRDSEYDYLRPKDQKVVGMVALHAIKNPKVDTNGYKQPHDLELMKYKVESIFKIGILHKYNVLILGALGAGAYRNPPDAVAKIFKNCIIEYGKYFKRIIFAIYSKNDNNYDIFTKILNEN